MTQTFKIGDTITHTIFGKGEIVYTEEIEDNWGRIHNYFDVHFESDEKYKVRKFSPESIEGYLVEHIEGVEDEDL